MCPKQSLEPCQKHVQAQRERQSYILLAAEEWVLRAASTKELEERKFVVDSGASVHMVSKKDLNSAELETGANKRRSNSVCQRIGIVRDSSFSWEALQRSWVYLPLDQRSKTTSHQKGEENCKISNYVTIRSPWFIYEFLYNAHTFFIIIFITGFRI